MQTDMDQFSLHHTQEKVSLVIPTHERPVALANAVRSGLAALPENGELIVIDDGTEHAASETLNDVTDRRLRIEKTSGSQGPSSARNLGVSHSTAELVFFLDDDDSLMPDYVARVLTARARTVPVPSFGFSAMSQSGTVSRKALETGPIHKRQNLSERLGGLGMGFWIEKALFEAIGGLDETIRINEDTEFCLRLAADEVAGWYESQPGVEINASRTQTGNADAPSITKTSALNDRADVFELLLSKYSQLLIEYPKTKKMFERRVLKYTAQSQGFRPALYRAKRLGMGNSSKLLIPQLILWRATHLLGKRQRAR